MEKCREILNISHVFRALDNNGISTSRITLFNMIKSQIQDQNKFK
jgi:hypothetical protein